MNTEQFIAGYIACALWSSTDDNGESLDMYDADDIAPEVLAQMQSDCADFLEANAELLDQSELSAEQAGHDFWLTRNRHGAGFWDRGLGPVGEQLSAAAKVYGGVDLYIGDDSRIYA
jgi:hypothetical protein